MRILVTGSRTWTDRPLLYAALDKYRPHIPRLVLVHGGGPRGVDRMADDWGLMVGLTPERHKADWERYGRKRAGFIRNAEMVKLGGDVCVTFIMPCADPKCLRQIARGRARPHGTHGSAHCAALAERAGFMMDRHGPVLS